MRLSSFKTIGLLGSVLATSWLAAPTVNAQTELQSVPEVTWDTRLSSFNLNNQDTGRVFTFNCPSISSGNSYAVVWGTDFYTINSGLCGAALHAGMITSEGGLINVELNSERSLYSGSDRFGVVSRDYQRDIASMRFIGNPIALEEDLDSREQSRQNRPRNGRSSTVEGVVGNGVRRGIERTISDSIRDIFR